jgi:hypothetical protein
MSEDTKGAPNRLIHEKSPYLLQHAHNPVDWYPWGDEAFDLARRDNKPVFLSIGYATCHWCHVMAHESFEDDAVAALMNEAFVCVKVDREERPDIDSVYMTVCQLMIGHGGWPLTVLLTPDKQPFFAGTYYPKKSRPNMIGMLELVPRLKSVWTERRDEVGQSVEQIADALQKTMQLQGTQSLDESILTQAYNELSARFDPTFGGFGTRPKFPTPHQLTFLLRYWKRTGEAKALEMVETTLQGMRCGGVYDHIGFGFHRYSTDAQWLLPHFEKMLYDQALLAIAYTECYQVTRKPEYRQTAEEIFEYVLRDMTSPEGGFYSAEDADSEGEEGKFYVWSQSELTEVLGSDDASLIEKVYNITPEGNFFEEASGHKTGTNIPHLKASLDDVAADLGIEIEMLKSKFEHIRQALFERRNQRIHPLKDDKILTDWNGLMIAALAKAARAFGEPRYEKAAAGAVSVVQRSLMKDHTLLHRLRDGEATIFGYLSDHAFFIWGLLELYEASFDSNHLELALKLNQYCLEKFWDDENGGFFLTAHDSEVLPVRQKDIHDGAIPGGNSVAMLNLIRLARITRSADLEDKAWTVSKVLSDQVSHSPSGFTQFFQAMDFAFGPSFEVVIVAADTKAAQPMLEIVHQQFLPNSVIILSVDSANESLDTIIPSLPAYQLNDGTTTAYVCQNFHCEQPLTNADSLKTLLGDLGNSQIRPT